MLSEEEKAQEKNMWHAMPVNEAFEAVESSPDGLSGEEAGKRLEEWGPNTLAHAKKQNPVVRFLLQFHNVLIYVLLVAAVVTALLQEWVDSIVIFGVCVINALIGFIQEGKAEKSMESIRNMMAPKADVLRDNRRATIEADKIVHGDVVLLNAGDKVPADMRLFEASDLQIEEAALTGESVPSEKNTYEVDEETALGDRSGMAFSGTMVTYGQARGVVVGTGIHTEIGRISELLGEVETMTTPLLRQVAKFGHYLTVAILLFAALTFIFGIVIQGYGPAEMFMAAVGLAVAAIPEGLPAIMTITLAIGVQAMARRNAIIRKLPAVETLGSVTIICSDKTGTLTKNEMTVQYVRAADHLYGVTGTGYAPDGGFRLDDEEIKAEDYPMLMEVLRFGLLCNDAEVFEKDDQWKLQGTPTEGALITAAMKAGIDPEAENENIPRIDVIPFSSEIKLMATLNRDENENRFILLKGAPERIMDRCVNQRTADGEDTGDLDQEFWQKAGETMASKGQRLLAIAVKNVDGNKEDLGSDDIEEGFTLLGLYGIIDPPREEAIEAAAKLIGECVSVAECQTAGIKVKMITGDHGLTAVSIADKLGIGDGETFLTGTDLEKMSDEELAEKTPHVDVYARTSPEQKLRLVKGMQAANHIVAMTGDGVNDAPALKRADVGVSMGRTGTEASKEASDMVLADDNFATIANAVEEGRTIYDNIKKAILFLLVTNSGQALVVIVSIVLGLGLMDAAGHFSLPISPPQILWINMVTAVTLALSTAFEPSEPDIMQRPPRSSDENIVTGFMLWRILFVGVLLVTGTLLHYGYMLGTGASQALASTAAINTLVVGQVFYLINNRFMYEPSWTLAGFIGSRAVLISVAVLAVLQLSFTYFPPMQFIFGTEGLPIDTWITILAYGMLLFILVEIEKIWFRRKRR